MSSNILGSEWHISAEGINIVTENGLILDSKKVLKLVLDSDLKQTGDSFLANELTKESTSKIVLQIQKIRNISAPKANENSQAAPRMLKIILTDGHTNVQAIEISPVHSISREKTPPGTKVLINCAKIYSGFLLINSSTCSVLGGEVPHMYEKWILAKSIQQTRRNGSSGAPAWVNFGSRIKLETQENNFKALVNKESNSENPEFEQQRKEAIAEAVTGAVKKTFGGRVKQNVQQVTNTNNYNKKSERPEKGKRGKINTKDEDDDVPLKPSDKVSLFSFLENKLPANEVKSTASNVNTQQTKVHRNQENSNSYRPKQFPNNQPQYGQQPQYQYSQNTSKEQTYNHRQPNNIHQNRGYNQRPQSFDPKPKNYPPRNDNYQKSSNAHFNKGNQENHSNNYNYQNSNPRYQNQYPKPQQQQNSFPPQNSGYQKDLKSETAVFKQAQEVPNNVVRNNVNSEFATRSFRQHLNLGPQKKYEEKKDNSGESKYANIGEDIKAKYWEDNQYYDATITAITDKTYVVKFKGYGNIEEVLKEDCLPLDRKNNMGITQRNHNASFSGSMEFRRSPRN